MNGRLNGGDPGLQPERTELAWRRTHLSLVVATLVVARHPLAGDHLGLRVGTAALVAVLAAFLLVGRRRAGVTAAVAGALAVIETIGIVW